MLKFLSLQEEEELTQKIKEKAVLKKLEQKLEEVSTICACRTLQVQRSQSPVVLRCSMFPSYTPQIRQLQPYREKGMMLSRWFNLLGSSLLLHVC